MRTSYLFAVVGIALCGGALSNVHIGAARIHPAEALSSDEQIVYDHVADNIKAAFRGPSGMLKYPYIVPAGPYNELWDWDSLFMGVATLNFGSAEYLAGSMMNFLDHTNLTTGGKSNVMNRASFGVVQLFLIWIYHAAEVPGCVTPDGGVQVLAHAKPIIIQVCRVSFKRP